MNARLIVDGAHGRRSVSLASYLDASSEEAAREDAHAWIKELRRLRVGDGAVRSRFTIRGDSLWWFTEIYLHKQQAILSAIRAITAFDALVAREAPRELGWESGDGAAAAVIRAAADARGVPLRDAPRPAVYWRMRAVRLRLRAMALHAAGLSRLGRANPHAASRRPQVVAFVHRAFVGRPSGSRSGERYIGHVLDRLASRLPADALVQVALGPSRNFRARRVWDPLMRPAAGDEPPSIEGFGTRRDMADARRVWRSRRQWLRDLESSVDIRNHAWIRGVDCWSLVREQLAGVAWLQWPWSAWAMAHAGAALDRLKPSACVTYAEAGGWGRAIALECRRRGIPLIGLQHGFIYRHWLNYRHEADEIAADPAHASDAGFPVPDLTLVFDEYAARHLTTAGSFPAERVHIVGSAARDELVHQARQMTPDAVADAARAAGAESGQHLVILATKYSEAAGVLPALIEAVASVPSVHLSIKTHPAETADVYAKAVRGSTASILPPGAALAPLLAAARAVVTVNSTVAIDALALGVPSLSIGLPNNLSPFVAAGAMLGANAAADIAAALRMLVMDEQARAALVAAGQRLIGASSGRAADASADLILEAATRASARRTDRIG